jgi:hypothetical protein
VQGWRLIFGLPMMLCQISAIGATQGLISNLNASYAEYARQFTEEFGETPPQLPTPDLISLFTPATVLVVWLVAFAASLASGAIVGGVGAFLYNVSVRWTGGIEVELT